MASQPSGFPLVGFFRLLRHIFESEFGETGFGSEMLSVVSLPAQTGDPCTFRPQTVVAKSSSSAPTGLSELLGTGGRQGIRELPPGSYMLQLDKSPSGRLISSK